LLPLDDLRELVHGPVRAAGVPPRRGPHRPDTQARRRPDPAARLRTQTSYDVGDERLAGRPGRPVRLGGPRQRLPRPAAAPVGHAALPGDPPRPGRAAAGGAARALAQVNSIRRWTEPRREVSRRQPAPGAGWRRKPCRSQSASDAWLVGATKALST